MMNLMNQMNPVYTSSISTILAEDVNTPELWNPMLSGMSNTRMNLFSRLFRLFSSKK